VNDKNRNLLVRIVTAVVLLPIVLVLLGLGGWWCAGLVSAAAAGCAGEYAWITQRRIEPAAALSVLGAALMPLIAAADPLGFIGVSFWILAAVFAAASIEALFAGDR